LYFSENKQNVILEGTQKETGEKIINYIIEQLIKLLIKIKCLQNYKYVCDFLVGHKPIFSIRILIFEVLHHTLRFAQLLTQLDTNNYIHTIRYTAIHTQLQPQ